MNDAAIALLIVIGVVWFVIWLVRQIPARRWRCPECGFETNDEAHALGHTKYQEKHKPYEI